MFEFLFYNNYRFAASHRTLLEFNDLSKFPEVGTYNIYFVKLARAMYDMQSPFIAGNPDIIRNANEHILVEPPAEDKQAGMQWPETSTKYNQYLQVDRMCAHGWWWSGD